MRAILVDIAPKNLKLDELEDRMIELENLVNTFWWVVVLKKIQKRDSPDYNTYVWSGKLEEIRILAEELKADIVIIWNVLKSAQIYNINDFFEKNKTKIKARDRVDLILKIFDIHAVSPESKLQIELASIKHMWPRIFGMWMQLSRQWWWIWTSGIGETNTEIMKRHLREREEKILEKLKKYEKTRAEHRKSRARKNLKTIWIVGYTNVGKSSLLNSLTHKWVLSENKLFATLWTSVWKMIIETKIDYKESNNYSYHKPQEVLLNDTIWFIRDLPMELVKAFSSTLEDSIESDLLLHVIDASDPKVWEKIESVEKILEEIWAHQKRIYVFNKIDLITKKKIAELKKDYREFSPIFISSEKRLWLEELKERVGRELES